MRILATLAMSLLAACGAKPGHAGAAQPQSSEPPIPTSFTGATRTWFVNGQSVDNCTVVDIVTCPDGGDIESCSAHKLTSYPCPPEGMWESSPWHIYLVDGTCWLHGEPTPQCEGGSGDDCKPTVTRKVACPV